MSVVFDTAVMFAMEALEELPAEVIEETIENATAQLEIIPTLLCSLPAEPDSPIGEFVEAGLRVTCNWGMASKAEKIALICFLDIVGEMIGKGEVTPVIPYFDEEM